MRIPLSWLKEFVTISDSPEKIAHLLTMAGIEVEHWETIGENVREIVVAKVITSEKHPQADKLSLASVTDGKNIYQIVCGASNCRAGIKVALARVGTTVSNGKHSLVIKKAKIRGVESEGMLCSAEELGLPETKGEGIIEIPDHIEEGTSLAELYADTLFTIALTPNLNHCGSIIGIARELGALTKQPVHIPQKIPNEAPQKTENYLSVVIEDTESCPRYTCRIIQNVQVAASPHWLKSRLEKCGLRSINTIVDITNYVLLEMGHPLHAFDYDKVAKHQIVVRQAKNNEIVTTLDEKKRILHPPMLTISDSNQPIAIAGVMGASNAEIDENSKTIILESAYFQPVSIRKTSKQLALQTDASKKYERGTDPNALLTALNRAVILIQEVAGGEILAHPIDSKAKEFIPLSISCRLSRIHRILGIGLSRGEVEEIFQRLGFPYFWDGIDAFSVHIPTYRTDITQEIDLIEEVARLYGYDHIPRKGIPYLPSSLPSTPIFLFENAVRNRLVAEGLQEFITCDLIGPKLLEWVHDSSSNEEMIHVLNPTSIEQSILRTTLLPGLLQVVKYNIDHQNRDMGGFEIGRVHFREGESYKEQSVVALILSGSKLSKYWDQPTSLFDFFDLKGLIENLLAEFGIVPSSYKNMHLSTFHSGRQASIFVGELEIGSFGEIHPSIQRRVDVSQRIFFAECNLHDLLRLAAPLQKIQRLTLFPASERDWTLTINTSIPFDEIIHIIQKQQSSLLEELSLKNIYRNDKIGDEFHNITLHFVYRDSTKTVEQEDVEKEHLRLTTAVSEQLHNFIKIV